VAINDVLPLKAARCDSVANLLTKSLFEALGHQRPTFDGFVYIHYAAPPYSARISAIYVLPFGKVWLDSVCWRLCATPMATWSRTQKLL